MIRPVVLIILLIIFGKTITFGQLVGEIYPIVKVGPVVGVNIASLTNFDYSINQNIKSDSTAILSQPFTQSRVTKFSFGLACNIAFSKWYSLQSELTYFQSGVKSSGQIIVTDSIYGTYTLNEVVDITINYLQLPILSKFSFGGKTFKFHLLAGPALAYATSASNTLTNSIGYNSYTTTYDIPIKTEGIQRMEAFAIAGAGASIITNLGDFVVDFRYNLGFIDINDNGNSTQPSFYKPNKNNIISLSVGFLFDTRAFKQ